VFIEAWVQTYYIVGYPGEFTGTDQIPDVLDESFNSGRFLKLFGVQFYVQL
jgi:hypothetical protein